jgi:soluble lytic murein transglycosylase-like protein
MHRIISSAMLIAVAASSTAPATAKPARTVQLISMIDPDTQQTPPPKQILEADILNGAKQPTAALSFRVLDLPQRSPPFEPKERLGKAEPLSEMLEPDMAPTPSLTGQLAIPAWMRSSMIPTMSSPDYLPGCRAVNFWPTGFLKRDAELRRERYFALMSGIACEHGIPVSLFDAMIIQESQYDPFALSPKGAFGLSQLMPRTAASLGVDRFDVGNNLRGGARYLRAHLDRFGRYDLALAAYNAGPGRIQNGRMPAISETRSYVSGILDYWVRLAGAATNDTFASYPKLPASNRRVSLQYFQKSY